MKDWHKVHGDYSDVGDLVDIINPLGQSSGVRAVVLKIFHKSNKLLDRSDTRMAKVQMLKSGVVNDIKTCYVRIISRAWGNTRGLSSYSTNNSEDLKKS